MKKIYLLVTIFLVGVSASAQISKEISNEQFESILVDENIALQWREVETFQAKGEKKSEDQFAVYQNYLNALKNSELSNDSNLNPIISKEIFAVEELLKSLKK